MLKAHTQPGQPAAPAETRAFPVPGSPLHNVLADPAFRSKFHARLERFNPMLVWLYRFGVMPLFGAGRSVMLLATRGRKSGRRRYFPLGYVRIGGAIYVFSAWGRGSNWYRNAQAHPGELEAQIGFRRFGVSAQTLKDPTEIRRTLAQFVAESPEAAQQLMGWQPGRDRAETADFSLFGEQVLIVRFVER